MSRLLQVLLPAVLALAASIGSALWWGLPVASVHDEYSYLQAADTFSSGRLTNPPHPHWQHFERFHVLQQPTFFSKYPTGQALFLALGQELGHPILGVWLVLAGLAAAVAWLVAAFFRPPWPLVGGLLTAILFGLPNYWALSYWGGGVAALGGALVFGALPRLLRRGTPAVCGLFGFGLVLLALSRPLEGLVFAIGCAGILFHGLLRHEAGARRRLVLRWAAGALPVLALGVLWILVHNQATTGKSLEFPYQAYQEQYVRVPQLLWMEPGEPPAYRHLVHLRFYSSVRARFEMYQDPVELLPANWVRLRLYLSFFLGWILFATCLAAPWGVERRWWVGALLLAVSEMILFFGYQSFHPHYAAVLAGPTIFVAVSGLRALSRRLSREWLTAALAVLLLSVAAERTLVYEDQYLALAREQTAPRVQSLLEEQLEEAGGCHLILVRLAPDASVDDEWIANGADRDSQVVLWAHDMGAVRNGPFLDDYPRRHVWVLAVGADPRQARLHKLRDPAERNAAEANAAHAACLNSGGSRSSR